MKYIKANIQDGFMLRRGIRGKWLTVYWHKYGGKQESTERFHYHPWRWAISFVWRGYMAEEINKGYGKYRTGRVPFSISIYNWLTCHRIVYSIVGTRTLFIGLFRHQVKVPNATVKFKEGYGHYTEESGLH